MRKGEGDFRAYRRNLPHWRKRGALYFVTWRLHRKQMHLTPFERNMVVSALRCFDGVRYELFGYVVMDDHVHVLVKPEEGYVLEGICHSWKSFSAHELQLKSGRLGSLWQDESHDRIVRSEGEMFDKMMYIMNNSRKRWREMKEYPWAWVKGLEAGHGGPAPP